MEMRQEKLAVALEGKLAQFVEIKLYSLGTRDPWISVELQSEHNVFNRENGY